MNSSNFDTVTLVVFTLYYKKEDAIHNIQSNNTIIKANLIYASKVTHFNFFFNKWEVKSDVTVALRTLEEKGNFYLSVDIWIDDIEC